MKNIESTVTGFLLLFVIFFSSNDIFAQEIQLDEFLTYSKQSNFIKEIPFPTEEFGLSGITTDKNGNAWTYYATQNSSLISKFDPVAEEFSKFDITKMTQTEDIIINLSGGHIIYDELRNTIWFTDARTNSIGKFSIENEQMDTIDIPTENSGPMGIILSQDKSKIWFTELSSDQFASLDIETNQITEYPIKSNSGPSFLAFDENGSLLITLSYSNSVLVVPLENIQSNTSSDRYELSLPEPDFFSPFGIAIFRLARNRENHCICHGSSRVIVSDLDSSLNEYISLWTSPNELYPQTLPSQIDLDEFGNIYFAQHGGNKISKIDTTGTITEYDIPTGPLSTTIYLDVSKDGKKVWFAEVLGNKIGYLDTSISVPFDLQTETKELIFTETKKSGQVTVEINRLDDGSGMLSLDNLDVSLVGMTHSGLDGVSFTTNSDMINLNQKNKIETILDISIDQNIEPGIYQTMLQISAHEIIDDSMKVSKLYPLTIIVDLPKQIPVNPLQEDDSEFLVKDVIQYSAIGTIVILLSLLVYNRIKISKQKKITIQE
ncbi:virginiamycin B lyase family protein [Nitrosopumilus ureiphilus]|uniref:Lyase n=1 Tax=Nitrosopumilus ureiphilus TaxID=1470067 RepID=A0A7D5RDK7_9ARCH|nr:hypothetical protein [Nitrosopumilus ureiphilus]QLH06343.1 hypothetical protein C5F50_04075 [Nitrosopumilus ureiphilus]